MRTAEAVKYDVIKTEIPCIDSDTFKPTKESVGYGCWGEVSVYQDAGGQEWAIKSFSPNSIALEQMKERNWTKESVMRSEYIPLSAAYHHVVPRIIERDKTGEMFVAMPLYREGDLSKKVDELDLRTALKVTRDVADALSYLHSQKDPDAEFSWGSENGKRKAHGDVKPSNILMEDGRAFLSDLGSSTCISVNVGSGRTRGPHGDVNYRAPECFKPDAKPSTRADVFSLGAILYSAVAKEGLYEGCPNLFELSEKEAQKIISKKIRKNTPRKLRKFLGKCLAVSEWDRFRDGEEAFGQLEKVIENLDSRKVIKNHIKKWTLPISIPAALVIFGAYQYSTYEPQKLQMPNTQRVFGMLEKPNFKTEGINFEMEDIKDLPKAEELGWVGSGNTKMAKLATDNRVVAYLAKTHSQAVLSRGLLKDSGPYTHAQIATYMAYTTNDERQGNTVRGGPTWPVWAKSIEVALTQSKTTDGKVDLEDVMTTCRLGIEKVDEAKRISRSVDYKDYRNAKDSKGNYIIPKAEQKFIETWLAYYNADID